jgi:glycolate oxidase iron-sulfur subunit
MSGPRTPLPPGDPLAAVPQLLDCMHCGLCLQECPTYRATGIETESPRGRLFLMRAVTEGRVEAAAAAGALDRCLQCRACEPVCPSKVGYAEALEHFREGSTPTLLRAALRSLLPVRSRMRILGLLLRLARRSGLLGLLERRGGPQRLDGRSGLRDRLDAMAAAVPARPERFVPRAGSRFAARGEARGRVALHLGCAQAELLGGVLRDTVRLLTAQGFEVVVPAQPACCGALHAHAGDAAHGGELAEATAAAFARGQAESGPVDAVLVPAAGCLAHLLERVPQAAFREPVLFLAEAGWRGAMAPVPGRVAYDPPCHLQNVVGGGEAIPALLARVPGLELREHPGARHCCGAGGVAFAREPVAAFPVTAGKVGELRACGAQTVATGNPGCMMRLEAELRRTGGGVEVVHPVTLLARAAGPEA